MMTLTPAEARRELKELGFACIKVRANGATTWVLANLTVFVPAKSPVSETVIRDARRHAHTLSIADVFVQDASRAPAQEICGPNKRVGSPDWMDMFGPDAYRICRHPPKREDFIKAVDVVAGRVCRVTIQHFDCGEHRCFGIYSVSDGGRQGRSA